MFDRRKENVAQNSKLFLWNIVIACMYFKSINIYLFCTMRSTAIALMRRRIFGFATVAILLIQGNCFSPRYNPSKRNNVRDHDVLISFTSLSAEDVTRNNAEDSSGASASTPDSSATAVLANNNMPKSNNNNNNNKRVSILVCPAQFCVPGDYVKMFENLSRLKENNPNELPVIGTCRVAPLPRTEWIKVARQLPTKAFLEGKLPVLDTLKWYFDAIEEGLADIFASEGADANICIVGHSSTFPKSEILSIDWSLSCNSHILSSNLLFEVGGWVARGYLGGISRSSTSVHRLALEKCSSLITLGTPHVNSDSALVDQTRGLLQAISETPSCHPQSLADQGIDITCVSSRSIGGKFISANIEEVVAASSYLPLLGRTDENTQGDGIVPLELAFMEPPSRRVIVDSCSLTNSPVRHSHVLPTPWRLLDGKAPSIELPDFPSYVSEGVLSQWAEYIQ